MRKNARQFKVILLLCIIATACGLFFYNATLKKEELLQTHIKSQSIQTYAVHTPEPRIEAKSAVLIDGSTGQIIYKKNENESLPPASMSKMMTAYILLENIKKGKIHWEDSVTISQKAEKTEGAKISIHQGDILTIKDLYYALLIQSANNSAVALAEHIASTEDKFVELMNQKAKQLRLSNQTFFVNASGLQEIDGSETKMPAIDVAKVAFNLVKDYPEVLETTKLSQSQLVFKNIVVKSTNKMLDQNNMNLYFNGMDGLKSGFTDSAGYCFTGTAKQENKRLISVVMGTDSIDKRFTESQKLLSYGFQIVLKGDSKK